MSGSGCRDLEVRTFEAVEAVAVFVEGLSGTRVCGGGGAGEGQSSGDSSNIGGQLRVGSGVVEDFGDRGKATADRKPEDYDH